MLSKFLRKFGYVRIDYGVACGRRWISVDDKKVYQGEGADLYMNDNQVRMLGHALFDDCVWRVEPGDEGFVAKVRQRWPWHWQDVMREFKNMKELSGEGIRSTTDY